MNRLYTYLLLLVCFTWVSCSSDDKPVVFHVKMSVGALGDEKEYTLIDFADPTDEITVLSTQPSWATVSYYTNNNNQLAVVVIVEENTEDQAREHQYSLMTQKGNQFFLDIIQDASQVFERSLDFAGKGESKTITLEDFTPPVLFTEGLSDWIQMEWKSETSKDVTIKTTANPSGAERSALITLKDSQGNRTILHVTQQFMKDDSDSTSDHVTDQEAL